MYITTIFIENEILKTVLRLLNVARAKCTVKITTQAKCVVNYGVKNDKVYKRLTQSYYKK